jgi:hypothetical protein
MQQPLTPQDIRYICKYMMNIEWLPSFLLDRQCSDVLRILSICQSKLEIMYFLGIGYYLNKNWSKGKIDYEYPWFYPESHQELEGIHISEPFVGGTYDHGLSSLLVIPQYPSPEKPIYHDFAFFSGEHNGGGPWHFYWAIEIEGYGIHKQRRAQDEKRYEGLSYPVIRVYEETISPLEWYAIFDPDVETGVPGEYGYFGDGENS